MKNIICTFLQDLMPIGQQVVDQLIIYEDFEFVQRLLAQFTSLTRKIKHSIKP